MKNWLQKELHPTWLWGGLPMLIAALLVIHVSVKMPLQLSLEQGDFFKFLQGRSTHWNHLFEAAAAAALALAVVAAWLHALILRGAASLPPTARGMLNFVLFAAWGVGLGMIGPIHLVPSDSARDLLLGGVVWAIWLSLPRFSGAATSISGATLFLVYALLGLAAVFPLAPAFLATIIAFHFLSRHRLAAYIWPTRLPKLKRPTRGFTLIELLICIAIMAVTVAGAGAASRTSAIAQRRARDWSDAVRLAEAQIEILRGEGAPPEPGTYPIDAKLAEEFPLAANADFEIRPATAGLREARARVRIRNESENRVVTLAALLPARPAKEAPRP